jgi:integrative and conjugative element protein (TIGR02256 family)
MSSMRSALVWHGLRLTAGLVLVEADPLALMDKHWQDSTGKPESGGILLGYRRGAHLHVTMATAQQAGDRSWRYLFKRSARHHQEIALHQWNASDRKMDYLGEWHTHPEHHPSPSATDLNEWHKICRQRQTPMVFLIVGWSGELWLGLSGGVEIERFMLVSA